MAIGSGRSTILIVDDEYSTLEVLSLILSTEYNILTARNGREALDVATAKHPDLIILDIVIPDISGFEIMTRLKGIPETMKIPIIFLTSLTGEEYEEKGLLLGAADYITKPFGHAIVRARVRTQIQNVRQMREIELLSMIDVLTGIPNRRSFNIRMEMEWTHAVRERQPVSLLMLDVDNFKLYNDTYGHPQGDELLKAVARIFNNTVKRAGDMAARLGGEEFAVLLPNTELESAVAIAEHIRSRVEKARVGSVGGKKTSVTISIGVATMVPSPSDKSSDMIARADACLYAAKKSGKNRVSFEAC